MEKYSASYAVGSVYDFTLMAGDAKVSDFGTNEITLTLQVNQQEAQNPQAYYYNEQTNEWEHIDSGKYVQKLEQSLSKRIILAFMVCLMVQVIILKSQLR